jgi:adenylosuccinate lyase
MIARYTSDEMAAIWSDGSRYARWREVELAVLAAQVRSGATPPHVLEEAEGIPTPTEAQVAAKEAEVRHDLVAFIDAWTDAMSPETAGHVHRHLTSSDVVDTAQAIALAAATALILDAGRRLVIALAERALEHRTTLCVARTHGQPAAFDVLGHRLADFAFALDRVVTRLSDTLLSVRVANITGPVGTGLGLPPDLVRDVAGSLNLHVPPTTTQVVFRDATAAWVSDLALLGAVCEAVATDIRLGQHDGVVELAEPWMKGQEGSSAMPHKRNPIAAENITGLARLLRGYVGPALEDVALWGHRDISHSSVERVVLPDAAAVCEHVLRATVRTVEGMIVDRDAVQANIKRAGVLLTAGRAQGLAQQQGLHRRSAAEAVRDRLRDGAVTSSEVEQAASEVLNSRTLISMFSDLEHLRDRMLVALRDA